MKQQRRNKPGAGRPQTIDVGGMAAIALILHVSAKAKTAKQAARAAILAYFTWGEYEDPERYVDIYLVRVLKALQRLESGRRQIHPMVAFFFGYGIETGLVERPDQIRDSASKFIRK